ncbi:efflux RND transporter permease subunit [Pelagibaculum spongiae]|uniref:RND transporter n=1 Tax=Pelagibaculum spongiae TaxID=2080658 RepID=A0A2V1GYQ5_9GAMM|nr:MMPL family transporter [Pelagibaculum spongiae]PVZ70477.1 RND transporter [Pelagibaculum spongiae]
MLESFISTVLRWRYSVLGLCMVLFAATLGGFPLTPNADYRMFFSSENPEMQAFEHLQQTYTKSDTLLFVISPKDDQVFSKPTLSIIHQLTDAAWQIPYSLRVDSITNYQHTEALEDDLNVASLVDDPAVLTDADLQKIKNIATNEPLLVKRLINPQGSITAILVTVQLPEKDKFGTQPEVVKASRALRDQFIAKYPDVEFRLTGKIMNNNAFKEATMWDLKHLVPVAFAVAVLCIAVYMFIASGASWITMISGTLGSLAIIFVSIGMAMGMAGWMGLYLTPPLANAPTMILTLAVADSIHILVAFFQQLRNGKDRRAAMAESLRINFSPVFITSITTVIGFLSLNFSDTPPFHDLGNTVAIGVTVAWLMSITLLPALMMILPIRVSGRDEQASHSMEVFADWVIAHSKKLLPLSLVLIIATVAFMPANKLYDNWAEYFDESLLIRQVNDYTKANLTGLATIEYSLSSGESGGISNPEFLATVDAFTDWYRSQSEVVHVQTITDTFKQLNQNMHAGQPEYYQLPEQRDLAAQYLLMYEMSLPFGLDLNNQIDIDKSSIRLTATLKNLPTSELLGLQERAKSWLNENAPKTMYHEGSSSDVMFAHISYNNMYSMLEGAFLAMLVISAILAVALKSAKFGLISLLPNMLPIAVGFGLWGMLFGQVGLGLSMVTGVTMGIVVDYTVHFLSKFLRAQREQGLDTADAIRYAFKTVGVALFVTTIILVANFGVLAFSVFGMNSDAGILTAATILIALFIDFIFLPPLLLMLIRSKAEISQPELAKAA